MSTDDAEPWSDLRVLFDHPGPFTTLVSPLASDPSARARGRREAESALREVGAPDATLGAIDEALSVVSPDSHGVAVVAVEEGVVLLEGWERPPPTVLARCEALPSLLPLLERRQDVVPHVLLALRPHEAHVLGVGASEPASSLRRWPSDPGLSDPGVSDRELERGWSDPTVRFDRRSTTEERSKKLAAQVDEMAARVGARAVVVWGDDHLVGAVVPMLTAPGARVVVLDVAPGRAPDEREIQEILAELRREEISGQLATLAREAEAGTAAVGPHAVVEAVRSGRVHRLVLEEAPFADGGPRAWFGARPHEVALEPESAAPAASPSEQSAPVADVLVRFALLERRELHVLPAGSGVPGGVTATR